MPSSLTFASSLSGVGCASCGAAIFQAALQEEGHCWDGKAAAVYKPGNWDRVQVSEEFNVNMIQGQGTCAHVHCGMCNATVGWKFVHSPIPSQTGLVGLMLPDVAVNNELCGESLVVEAPVGDELDELALAFMSEHGVLGMTAAFQTDGGAIVQRGWGYATESGEAMRADSQLRIASVSKTLTGVAVLQLVDQGKLDLDQPVMSILEQYAGCVKDPRMHQVTVRHLLHHQGGGWCNSGAAMFRHQDCSQDELIRRLLAEDDLDTDPGTTYAYSNFGYCLLGRVIEACSGLSYNEFVQRNVLDKCGLSGRCETDGETSVGEARYYRTSWDAERCHQSFPLSLVSGLYGRWRLTEDPLAQSTIARMDAHGGWLLSAVDLVTISAAIEQGSLLSEESKVLLTNPHFGGNYGAGVCVNTHARWHDGALYGTGSILVHTTAHGGMSWALIVNCHSSDENDHGCPALDAFAWDCVNTGAAQKGM